MMIDMEYYFYPPFFVIVPQSSFDEAWEVFCCELLNLDNQTNAIRRRSPPDLGADLIWESKKTIYQCKVVENGQAGGFKPDKVNKSIETAKMNQSTLGWNRFVLCTNVDLSGEQEKN
jgi:hypothetical protein